MLPVDCDDGSEEDFSEDPEPVLLIALNATDAAEWEELYSKVRISSLYLAILVLNG